MKPPSQAKAGYYEQTNNQGEEMGTRLDPYIHEHDTAEEAEAFHRALRARVEHARSSSKAVVAHEQVMEEARVLLAAQRAKHARKRG